MTYDKKTEMKTSSTQASGERTTQADVGNKKQTDSHQMQNRQEPGMAKDAKLNSRSDSTFGNSAEKRTDAKTDAKADWKPDSKMASQHDDKSAAKSDSKSSMSSDSSGKKDDKKFSDKSQRI